MRRTIDGKLTKTTLLTTGCSLLVACVVFVAHDVVTLRRSMVENASILAQVIAINSAAALTFDDARAARETLSALNAARTVRGAAIYGAEGELFASYEAELSQGEVPGPPPPGISGHRFDGPNLDLHHEIAMGEKVVGKIAIRTDTRELTSRIERYAVIVGLLFLAAAASGAAVASRLRREVAVPLKDLVDSSEAVADGNLSARVAVVTDDEIGVLANTFNAMAEGLRTLVRKVRQNIGSVSEVSNLLEQASESMFSTVQRQVAAIANTADSAEIVRASSLHVNENIEELSGSARETTSSIFQMDASIGAVAEHMEKLSESIDATSSGVNHVVVNIDEVVKGVDNLNSATEGSFGRLHQLSVSVQQVRDNAAESLSLSEDSSREAKLGMAAVNETVAAMGEISSSFKQLEASVSKLAERSQSIDEIIQVISHVAEQTSLLSLNASIIAAQAGEHGRPFAVVADQIKSLADSTHRSVDEIGALIKAVQDDTGAAVIAVSAGSARVEKGVQRSDVAGVVLRKIIEKSEVSTERVREIAQAAGRQSGDLERVDQAMREVGEIVSQIDDSTREQLRATTEIASAVESIRVLGSEVKISTEEQRRGSRLITNAVTGMADRIVQIEGATQDQTRSAESIHQTLQVFRDVSEETNLRAEAIRKMVSKLSERSQQLEREIGRFITD